MPRSADHEGFAVFGTQRGYRRSGGVRTEVNHDIGLRKYGFQVVPLIDLADQLESRVLRGAGDQCLAHASLGTGDNNARHGILS